VQADAEGDPQQLTALVGVYRAAIGALAYLGKIVVGEAGTTIDAKGQTVFA
jgi:hypothetical protein